MLRSSVAVEGLLSWLMVDEESHNSATGKSSVPAEATPSCTTPARSGVALDSRRAPVPRDPGEDTVCGGVGRASAEPGAKRGRGTHRAPAPCWDYVRSRIAHGARRLVESSHARALLAAKEGDRG